MRQPAPSSALYASCSGNNLPFLIRPFPSSDGLYPDEYLDPHRHNCFEFLWIQKGKGSFCVDDTRTDVSEGTACFVQPGQVHQLIETEPMEGHIITFSDTFLSSRETEFDYFYHARHFQGFAEKVAITFDLELREVMTDIICTMIREQGKELVFKQEVLRRYLKIFLLYFARQFEERHESFFAAKQGGVAERFIALVDKHFLVKKMVADYASELSVTPNYLNDIVKQFTGYTAGHHIRQRIIMEIKRQAIYTNASMKEIAYSLGFFDPAHFSKYFKNITGKNFTDFKRSLKDPVGKSFVTA
jgi:AraC family transcriptional regulator, transcriptional activator of pobA